MFKREEYKYNKVANHLNKSLQLTTLLIGLSLINSSAQARTTNAPQDTMLAAKEDSCVGQIALATFLP